MKAIFTRKTLLLSGLVTVLVVAFTVSAMANNSGRPVSKSSKVVAITHATKQNTSPVSTTQVSAQPTEQTVTQPEPQPVTSPSVTNPYPEGFNIWHVFNRRETVGLGTPSGPPSDETYWQGSQQNLTTTPTQYAIALSGHNHVAGFVESVNSDGSVNISCTNCGAGWNTYTEKQISADDIKSYKFIQ